MNARMTPASLKWITDNTTNMEPRQPTTLLHTSRNLYPQDVEPATWERLLETLADKQPVKYQDPHRNPEFGFVSGEGPDGDLFVKFVWDLLGHLWTDDAWESTTGKLCSRERITFLNHNDFQP